MNTDSFRELMRRIEGEIAESPRFSVTLPQAKQLWGIDYATSIAVFRRLTERGILHRTPRGDYIRE
jgi:Fic family protein